MERFCLLRPNSALALLIPVLVAFALPAHAESGAHGAHYDARYRAQHDPGARRLDPPGTGAMMVDLAVARPLGAAITVVGAAAFLVSLPFTVAGGNVGEAGEQLVVRPGRETFNRCLGCRNPGWRGDYPRDR